MLSDENTEEEVEEGPTAKRSRRSAPSDNVLGTLTPKEQCCLQGLQFLETLIIRDLWIAARVVENHLVGIGGYKAARALLVAKYMEQKNALDVLLKVGANFNGSDSKGNTLLHRALLLRRPDRVEIVLEIKRDLVAMRNKLGMTPLHLAANEGLVECVEMLLEAGTKHVKDDLLFPRTPWDSIMQEARETSVSKRRLPPQDVDGGPDVRDILGRTPLYLAALCGSEECVKVLLTAGADVNTKETFLWGQGRSDVFSLPQVLFFRRYNLSESALMWLVTIGGRTQLHIAADSGHALVAQTLISAGANVQAIDTYWRTPLHLAASQGHVEVVKILLAAGADVKTKDKRGETPRDKANTREIEDMLPE